MVLNGEKISVRNVSSRTGGDTARVLGFIKQWRSEQEIKVDENNIPDDLKIALIKFRMAAINDAVEIYKTKNKEMESLSERVASRMVRKYTLRKIY
ncbi:MAG: DNA-binding protein [Neisseriaceae bacterium]|jgi:DNA-binding protein YbaB